MAIISKAGKVYFDTNILIYMIENHPDYHEEVTAIANALDMAGYLVITSELTLAECLVKPFAANDKRSQDVYINSLKNTEFLQVKPVTKKILIEAARLRSIYKNKLPDSIHLATALTSGCDVFIGNDKKIKVGDEIKLILLES